ncbi:MAG: NUDIX domain-containing protein [Pseudomonadota bacterium]
MSMPPVGPPTASEPLVDSRAMFPVVVHVVLRQADSIFLLKRGAEMAFGGRYGLPGGHLERGETLVEAAVRECREETGTMVFGLQPLAVLSYVTAPGGERAGSESASDERAVEQGLNIVFHSDNFAPPPRLAEMSNFTDCGFFPDTALPDAVIPWVADVGQLLAAPPAATTPPLILREYRWD